MRIAHFGPFDTQSYGDLLLPLIVERRLSDLCDGFVHVSPGGGPPHWEDCAPTTAAAELLRDPPPIDGVIFSGESILPHSSEARKDDGSLSLLARSGLWLTAAYVAARDGLPLCLNAPGASEAAPEDLAQAALLADIPSAREGDGEHRMGSTPDLTLEVSGLWSRDELSAAYSAAFSSRDRSVPERTIAFDVGDGSGEDASDIAARLDGICESAGASPVLISLEPGSETPSLVARRMSAEPLTIDRPRSLQEATACISRSEAYIGSSPHGVIAACSFGKRGMLVSANEEPEAKDFLERFGLASWASASWSQAQRRADELLAEPEATWERALQTASPALESHWNRIREALDASCERAHRQDSSPSGLEAFRASLEENTQMLRRSSAEISALRQRLEEVEQSAGQTASGEEVSLAESGERALQNSREVENLARWIEELERGISALLGSRQFKAGQALGELRRQALRQPRVPMAQDHLHTILQDFHAWRDNQTSGAGRASPAPRPPASSGGAPGAAPAGSAPSGGIPIGAFLSRRRIANELAPIVKRKVVDRAVPAVKGRVVRRARKLKPRVSKEILAGQIRDRLGPAPELRIAPLVSIVILNRNGLSHLKKLLAGLRDNTDYPNFEVVLVDNGSTDGSVEFVKSFEAGFAVEMIENSGNVSYSAGNNQGVESASGELLLFLNNDVEPFEVGWLREMVARMQRTRAGAVGAFLLYPGRTDYPVSSGYAVQHRGIRFRRMLGSIYPRTLEGDDALGERLGEDTACPAVTAACLLMERETFEGAGGFETGYRYGGEDVDLCLGLHFSGREIVSSGRAALFHDVSSSQDREGDHFKVVNRKGNRRLFKERWGPRVSREFYRDRLGSGEFWTEEKPHIAITLTSLDMNDGYGDWYTGHEIGDALQARGWRVSYVQKKNDEYYSLPDGVDYVLALLHWYDASRVSDVTTIAWIRNWTERWVEHPWFEHFDVVLASSTISKEIVERRTGKAASVFPIAANPRRFQRTLPDPTYEADYVFTGNHWGADKGEQRMVESLDVMSDERVLIFGKGWEHVARASRYARGHLPYNKLPQVYSSAKLVIDDAGHTTRPYGSVNSRVFDALAAGTLVVSSCKEGVRELFDEDFPTYDDRKELRENLDILLNDDSRREELAARYQDIVLREHTYAKRAGQLTELLRQRTEALSFCIKIGPRNWEKAPWWGDLHYARAMQRQLEQRGHPCTVQVLEEWDDFEGLEYDVAIHLKGLEPYTTKPAQLNVLWSISHPDLLTSRECDKYDLVFVASERFAEELRPGTDTPIVVLEQATDPQVFYPEHDAEHERDMVFVGNSRKVERRILRDLLPTKHDLGVWGGNWEGLIPDRHILGQYLPNDEVRRAYTSASIVLNDHWDDMREHGFVSNRIYDALACGALVISDKLPEIEKSFGEAVITYSTPEELQEIVEHYLNSPQERAEKGKQGRELVLQRHTFEHRMSEFLEHLERRRQGAIGSGRA